MIKLSHNELVISIECFNQHMDWSYDYFKKLRQCLEQQKSEVTYSFAPSVEEGEDQIRFVSLFLSVNL